MKTPPDQSSPSAAYAGTSPASSPSAGDVETTSNSTPARTGSKPKKLTAAELAAENESLRRQLAERTAADEQAAADEAVIKVKMDAGLSRPQAVAVFKRQRAFDEARAIHVLPQREEQRARQQRRNEHLQRLAEL
jgi:hypothetical protein